ncbi:MAG: hypothetical protein HW387_157 [Parachlamydiales bacterium]|nr:hypothetical protein [Parachlamydiales bacterium]
MINPFRLPLIKTFRESSASNVRFIFLTFIPYVLAGLLEGSSFAFIYSAFLSLNGSSHDNGILAYLNVSKLGWNLTSLQLFYLNILSALLLQCFRSLISFLAVHETTVFALKMQVNLQKKIYRQIFRFSFPFVSEYKTGELSEMVKSPSSFVPVLFAGINQLLVSLFMAIGLLVSLYCISPRLTFVNLIFFLLFGCVQKIAIKNVFHFSKLLANKVFDFSHETIQILLAIKPIHMFNREDYFLDKANSILDRIFEISRKSYFWNNLVPSLSEVLGILMLGAILITGSLLLNVSTGDYLASLLTYVILSYRLAVRLQTIVSTIGGIGLYSGTIHRLAGFLEDHDKQYRPIITKEFAGWSDSIEFRNISFTYPSAKNPVLTNLSLSIKKNKVTALVGLSGTGKSSILDLLLSLHMPNYGEILVDSHPMNVFSPNSWREKIGAVNQEVFIINGTIEENLLFGEKNISQSDFDLVTKSIGIADFVSKLPDAYRTMIGERGYKLSGGQRQRIALGRALLRNPEILVLDEATSSLDSISEQIIIQNLTLFQKNKTFVIVAHRLSTIIHADIIYVIEKGRVIESGKHEELVQLNGRYSHLWGLQSLQE